MNDFLIKWGEAANTSIGFFWMALWAFILGYALSSMIQVFVTEERMQKTMGGSGAKSVFLGTFFGFISSSCSFSALASAKSLFKKGASFISSLAFMLSSTNLVIELGIVISIFLGWQFVVGEYVGGVILILFSWLLVRLINPSKLIKKAKDNLGSAEEGDVEKVSFKDKIKSQKEWAKVGKQYFMEWKMVWKDVTIGFTIAGIVAAFVPDSFFETLFINTGNGEESFSFFTLLEHVVIGPVAAFLTFIGSMGNIPLAALLFGKGVSFAGVMAFIFSDLVVFPVLRINAKYYGWRMSFFILFLLFASLIVASLGLHYGFDLLNMLPDPASISIMEQSFFKVDYTLFMNIGFFIVSGVLIYFGFVKGKNIMHHKEMAPKSPVLEKTLKYLSFVAYLWLLVGVGIEYLYIN
ncbi:permease [uncultured Marivirga sp.]|uniref:permease n=1 Tax=uncultured Marivirga sp. TaxID=1123707 RepID=UPI0030EB6A37|tara:strand:+ start:235026 stop:236249 length:1224 start_codon:yes stop_codon:yes gene_type:complete